MSTVQELFEDASPEAARLVCTILRQDHDDQLWDAQIGPALSQRHTAQLLGKSEQAVSKDRNLLRIRNRDDQRVVYPIVQFDGRRPVSGLTEILGIFDDTPALDVLVWLTGTLPGLDDRRPIDVLRDGQVSVVKAAAQRYVRHTS